MAHFSGAIKLADGINDYLAPSQDCVLPLMTSKSQGTGAKISTSQGGDFDLTQIRMVNPSQPSSSDASSVPGAEFGQMKPSGDGAKATITLADCLSCSGCVTTAETVLISQHSSQQFILRLQSLHAKHNPKYQNIQVSISMSSLLSLANAFMVDLPVMFDLLKVFFYALGVTNFIYAVDSQSYVLHESTNEFITRYRNRASLFNTQLPSSQHQQQQEQEQEQEQEQALSSSSSSIPLIDNPSHQSFAESSLTSSIMPLLSSECPGWVCLSEKTQGEKMIPFMSAVRTPQSVLGLFAKIVVDGDDQHNNNNHPTSSSSSPSSYTIDPDIYHVSIMPCYDKKLEATREYIEITKPGSTTSEAVAMPFVDLVLSTHELVDMLLGNVQFDDSVEQIDSSISVESITDVWTSVWSQFVYYRDTMQSDQQQQQQQQQPLSPTTPATTPTLATTMDEQPSTQQQHQSPSSSPPHDPSDAELFNFEIHPFVPTQYSPCIATLGHRHNIYRPPGFNTSSGGYAETIFYESLKQIYNVAMSEDVCNSLYSLAWTPVLNNDVKMATCEYLGVGKLLNTATNDTEMVLANSDVESSEDVGIYAIYGHNAVIITHGAIIPPESTSSPFFTMSKKYQQAKLKCAKITPLSTPSSTAGSNASQTTIQAVSTSGANTTGVKLSTFTDGEDGIISPMPRMPIRRGANATPVSFPPHTILPSISISSPATTPSQQQQQQLSQQTRPVYELTKPLSSPLCVLSVSTAFGLRNIQSIIRQLDPASNAMGGASLKIAKLGSGGSGGATDTQPQEPPGIDPKAPIPYHYVEIMSCPSGCINGGAQLTASQINALRGTLNDRLQTIYQDLYADSESMDSSNADNHDGNTTAQQAFLQSSGYFPSAYDKRPFITQQREHLVNIQNLYESVPCVFNLPYHLTYQHGDDISPCLQYLLPKLLSSTSTPTSSSDMMNDDHHSHHQQQHPQQAYYSPHRSIIFSILQQYRISLMYTKYNPIQVNETLQALRW